MSFIEDKTSVSAWKLFLVRLLDGRYDFDVKKIGTLTAFVNNQISSAAYPNEARLAFTRALVSLTDLHPFNADSALAQPRTYDFIITCITQFLPYKAGMRDRMYLLFQGLLAKYTDHILDKGPLSPHTLFTCIQLLRCSSEALHKAMLADPQPYLKTSLADRIAGDWQKLIETATGRHNELSYSAAHALIQQHRWKRLPDDFRQQFIKRISLPEGRDVFDWLVDALLYAPDDANSPYLPFVWDCRNWSRKTLFEVLRETVPEWVARLPRESNAAKPAQSKKELTKKKLIMFERNYTQQVKHGLGTGFFEGVMPKERQQEPRILGI